MRLHIITQKENSIFLKFLWKICVQDLNDNSMMLIGIIWWEDNIKFTGNLRYVCAHFVEDNWQVAFHNTPLKEYNWFEFIVFLLLEELLFQG